jgi:hypothetical protein
MNDEMRNIKRIALLSLLIAGAFAPAVKGQILSRGNLFGPGAPPPMVGIEIGLGQHTEQGNLACDCGANFSGGTGTGLLGNLLFELPLDYDWAVGIKAVRSLALVGTVLRRKAEHAGDAKSFQLRKVIPESAGLRRASSSAGNEVPSRRIFDSRNSRSRIRIGHDEARQLG